MSRSASRGILVLVAVLSAASVACADVLVQSDAGNNHVMPAAGAQKIGGIALANHRRDRVDRPVIDSGLSDLARSSLNRADAVSGWEPELEALAATDLSFVATYADQEALTGIAPVEGFFSGDDRRFGDYRAASGSSAVQAGRKAAEAPSAAQAAQVAQLGVAEPSAIALWTGAGVLLVSGAWYRRRRAARVAPVIACSADGR